MAKKRPDGLTQAEMDQLIRECAEDLANMMADGEQFAAQYGASGGAVVLATEILAQGWGEKYMATRLAVAVIHLVERAKVEGVHDHD